MALSLKALRPDPWLTVDEVFKVGQKIRGTVIKIRSNGAFVQLNDDIIGLLPTAEFGGRPATEVVTIGEQYDCAIVNIDAKDHKLILTLEQKSEEK